MSVRNLVPIYQVDVEIFHRINENVDLMVVLEEKSGVHPLGTMNVCTKCKTMHPVFVEIFQCGQKW